MSAHEGAGSARSHVPASCRGTYWLAQHPRWGPSRPLKASMGPSAGSTQGLTSAFVLHLCYPSSPPLGAPKRLPSLPFQKPQLSPRITSLGPHSQRLAPRHSTPPRETGSQLKPRGLDVERFPSQRGTGTPRSGHTHPGRTSHR